MEWWGWIVVGAYLGVVAMAVVGVVCGDWPIFQGSIVQRFNHCCTRDSQLYLETAVAWACGDPGLHALSSLHYHCCRRPNPILQLFYFAILGGTYFSVVITSFDYATPIQRYVGTFGVIAGLFLFLVTSFSDPGTVTSQNASELLYVYPYDGVLYEEKTCSTCNIIRPARSKHCSICGHCVARFDHHCGWMNNCVGENNLRYFLAFLLWHCFLCIYGVYFLITVLIGEVEKRRVVPLLTVYFGIENSFKKLFPHILKWLLEFYSTQFLIIVFLFVTSLILGAFFGYHIHLVMTNVTTNETCKWENYVRWRAAVASEETEGIQSREAESNLQSEEGSGKGRLEWTAHTFGSSAQLQQERKNSYDRGTLNNIVEVLIPYPRRKALRDKQLKSA